MFVTSRDSGVRRRSKVYGNVKGARSSKLSLLSTFTITTNSSGGSNSTVTQDSYNRSQHKHRKRRQHRPRRPEPPNASVDVFDYLVPEGSQSEAELVKHDDKAESDDEKSDVESQAGDDQHAKPKALEAGDPEIYYRSMSDSGISMGSSTGHSVKVHSPVAGEYYPQPGHRGPDMALIDPRCMWPPYSPQPPHDHFIPPPCPPPPPAVRVEHMFPYQPYTPYSTPPAEREEVRRVPALLIREPVGQSLKPACFRPFTKLSARILLQMQDELADLEAELKLLDEETDIAARLNDRSSASARETMSRQDRESDIYEELHVKLDNYYHALEMIGKVEALSEPAITADLTNYHSWLESRIVEQPRIRPLVGNDLRRFSDSKKRKPTIVTPKFHPQYLAYCCLINAVIPLIMTKFVVGSLNRLILLSILVTAGALAQDRLRSNIGRDELACTLVCICISAFAAIFL